MIFLKQWKYVSSMYDILIRCNHFSPLLLINIMVEQHMFPCSYNGGCTDQSDTRAVAGGGGRQRVATGGNNIKRLPVQHHANNVLILCRLPPPTATCASLCSVHRL
jgi:hypothetical protein